MLNYNTVTPLLKSTLEFLMNADIFNNFRLVGGTALSLYRGHRMSVDIDLFTDADDDFEPDCLRGKHWELIKLDLMEFAAGL